MTRSGSRTREALIDAAEIEMAEHGSDGADLDAIRLRAGQKNRSAVQFHFGGREGLLDAIAVRHRTAANRARLVRLDGIDESEPPSLHQLTSVLVQPALTHLKSPSGRRYLVILAEVMARRGVAALVAPDQDPEVESVRRVNQMLFSQMSGSAASRRRRIGRTVLMVFVALADIARNVESGAITQRQARSQGRELELIAVAILSTDTSSARRSPGTNF